MILMLDFEGLGGAVSATCAAAVLLAASEANAMEMSKVMRNFQSALKIDWRTKKMNWKQVSVKKQRWKNQENRLW
jgi:hypothetical protein